MNTGTVKPARPAPPVLLISFKRPDLTRRMLENIRQAQPARFYAACDGPRLDRPDDAEKVRAVRSVIAEFGAALHPQTLYQETNLGCARGVSAAISWFFEHEEEGIILEDDCLPDQSFYPFCGELLERYRGVANVMQIAGYNALSGIREMEADYLFSHHGWQWGWATWRRAWLHFDLKMASWPDFKAQGLHQSAPFHPPRIRVTDEMYAGGCDTWDFQWQYAMAANYGLSVIPKYSLITNVGVGLGCTHGIERNASQDQHVRVRPVTFPLKHARFVIADPVYDGLWAARVHVTAARRARQFVGQLLQKCGLKQVVRKIMAFRRPGK